MGVGVHAHHWLQQIDWHVCLRMRASLATRACWRCLQPVCRAASRHVPTRCRASCRFRTDAWIHLVVGRLLNKTWSISWPSSSCECNPCICFLSPPRV